MQNPYRVTPPLMSEDTAVSTSDTTQERQPTFSTPAEPQAPAHQTMPRSTTVESSVEMESVQKNEQQQADNAVKASSSAQSSGDRKKTKKSPNAFRTISEVATELDVQQHVLRFWETKFSQVKPLTRGGGRRYYRPEDVAVLEKIHNILYTEGYTIKGAQNLLKGLSKGQVAELTHQRPASEQSNSQSTGTEQSSKG